MSSVSPKDRTIAILKRRIMNIKPKVEQQTAILSFLKCWAFNTNDTRKIGQHTLTQMELAPFAEEILRSFMCNRTYVIFGVDKARDFKMAVSSQEDVIKLANDLWKTPEDYVDIELDDDDDGSGYYYEFLKFLYVRFSDGNEAYLPDLVDTKKEEILFT